jgi:hypothetical protein
MTLPDYLAGKRYRCPLCFTYIEVPLPGAAAPPAVEVAKRPEPRIEPAKTNSPLVPFPEPAFSQPTGNGVGTKTEQPSPSPSRIDWGLGLHFARLITVLACILGIFLCLIAREYFPRDTFWAAALLLSGAIFLGAPLLGLIGSGLCLGAPKEGGVRHPLLLSLVLDLTTLPLCYVLSMLDDVTAEKAAVVWLAGVVLQTLSWTFFWGFLRQLARQLREDHAADEALRGLLRGLALFLVPPIFFGGLYLLSQYLEGSVWLFAVQSVPLTLYLLVVAVKFLLQQYALVNTLRQEMRNQS